MGKAGAVSSSLEVNRKVTDYDVVAVDREIEKKRHNNSI